VEVCRQIAKYQKLAYSSKILGVNAASNNVSHGQETNGRAIKRGGGEKKKR